MNHPRPKDWKNYEDFAHGIASNRLPSVEDLAAKQFALTFDGYELNLHLQTGDQFLWQDGAGHGGPAADRYEAVRLAEQLYFLDFEFASRPAESLTVIVNFATGSALAVRSRILSVEEAGAQPRVAQDFLVGRVGGGAAQAEVASPPCETRDLIGLRTFQTYSPEHTYEHTYLNSQRYAWQCLVGVQRGHGDVDLASYWKFDENLYVFTFREFLIPVASVFLFDFRTMRSTGKFLGLKADGSVSNSPAGAFITKASTTLYRDEIAPI